ncbi:alpha/beta hydrolase [Asticcacaulis sp.]|uniref:alpha/beta hydrolase n=1 Tax=Asticcacaulis sp. TaxID=1872648 RepID=UPI00391A1BE6
MRYVSAMIMALGLAAASPQGQAQPTPSETFGYSVIPPDFTAAEAARRLGSASLTYWVEGTLLRVAARASTPDVRLCCTVQPDMQALGEGLWGLTLVFPDLNRSVIALQTSADPTTRLYWRGPDAPAEPEAVAKLSGSLKTVEIESVLLKARRKLTLYTPKSPPPPEGYPVVYMADGRAVSGFAWVVERLIDEGVIRPVVLVGIWSGEGRATNGGFDQRNREYLPSPKVDPQAYADHEAFVLKEVMPLVEARYKVSTRRADRLTYGFSAGGSWSLSFALRHPDAFAQGASAGMSAGPGSFTFSGTEDVKLYIRAGRYDQFYSGAQKTCLKAQAAGLTCHFTGMYAGHDPFVWNLALLETLKAVFAARTEP